jgi:hypothetical protein
MWKPHLNLPQKGRLECAETQLIISKKITLISQSLDVLSEQKKDRYNAICVITVLIFISRKQLLYLLPSFGGTGKVESVRR